MKPHASRMGTSITAMSMKRCCCSPPGPRSAAMSLHDGASLPGAARDERDRDGNGDLRPPRVCSPGAQQVDGSLTNGLVVLGDDGQGGPDELRPVDIVVADEGEASQLRTQV